MAWLIYSFLITFSMCLCMRVETLPFQEYGVMTSTNGTFKFVGDSLELFCNITSTTVRENSSRLYIEIPPKDKNITQPFVDTLTTKTIRLRMSNLNTSDGGYYICKMAAISGNSKIIGSQKILVDYMPEKVKNISCRVYNWEEMNCTWDLGVNYIHLDFINVSLTWAMELPKNGRSYREQFDCPDLKKTSCYWDKDHYINGHQYYMTIDVSTVYERKTLRTEKSQIFRVETQLYVEPAPVEYLNASVLNSTCIRLNWQHSAVYKEKFFVAEFLDGDEQTWKTLILPEYGKKAKTFHFIACGLNPFTLYTFRVSVLPYPVETKYPVTQGHRSRWETVTAKTSEDVPGSAPKTCTGCFYETSCPGNEAVHCFQLYWQDLLIKDKNGIITNYTFTSTNIETGKSYYSFVLSTRMIPITSAIIKLPTNSENFNISFRPATSQGFARDSSFIFLPSFNARPNAPEHFLVEMDKKNKEQTKFYLNWTKLDMDAKTELMYSSVTIVWCYGNRQETECKGDIHWIDLPPNAVTYELRPDVHLYQDNDILIGITAEVSNNGLAISSGIHWSTCIYHYNEPPLNAPKNVIEVTKHPTNGLTIKWDKPDCSEERSYLMVYNITYCTSESIDKCTGEEKSQSVSSTENMVTLEHLLEEKRYRVIVTAVSSAGKKSSQPLLSAAVQSSPSGANVIVIIVISVCSVFFLLVILVALLRHFYNRKKRISKFGHDSLLEPYAQTSVEYFKNMPLGLPGRPLPKIPEEQHFYGSSACMNNHGSKINKENNSLDNNSEESVTSQSNLLSCRDKAYNYSPTSSKKQITKQNCKFSDAKKNLSTKEDKPLMHNHSCANSQKSGNNCNRSEMTASKADSEDDPDYSTIVCNNYSNEPHDDRHESSELMNDSDKISSYHKLACDSSSGSNHNETAYSDFSNTNTLPLRGHKIEKANCNFEIPEEGKQTVNTFTSTALECHHCDIPYVDQSLLAKTSEKLTNFLLNPSHALKCAHTATSEPSLNEMKQSPDYVSHSHIQCSSNNLPLNTSSLDYLHCTKTSGDFSDSSFSLLNCSQNSILSHSSSCCSREMLSPCLREMLPFPSPCPRKTLFPLSHCPRETLSPLSHCPRDTLSPPSHCSKETLKPPSPCPKETLSPPSHYPRETYPTTDHFLSSLLGTTSSHKMHSNGLCLSIDNYTQPQFVSLIRAHKLNSNGYTQIEDFVNSNEQSDIADYITTAPANEQSDNTYDFEN